MFIQDLPSMHLKALILSLIRSITWRGMPPFQLLEVREYRDVIMV